MNGRSNFFWPALFTWWQSGISAKCTILAALFIMFQGVVATGVLFEVFFRVPHPDRTDWLSNTLPYNTYSTSIYDGSFSDRLKERVNAVSDSLLSEGLAFAENIPAGYDSIEMKLFEQRNGKVLLYVDYRLACGCDSALGRFRLRRYTINPVNLEFKLAADDLRSWESHIPQYLSRIAGEIE